MVVHYKLHQTKDPATPEELQEVAMRTGATFSGAYQAFLLRHNGVTYFEPNQRKEIQFLSTSEIPKQIEVYEIEKHMPGGIPFAMDGCGNLLLFNRDSQTDSVYIASCGNLGWDDSIQIAGSFTDFLEDPSRPESYL